MEKLPPLGLKKKLSICSVRQLLPKYFSNSNLWRVIHELIRKNQIITFRIFKTAKVHRLNIINECWYLSTSFSLFCLLYFISLFSTTWSICRRSRHRFIIARAVCIRRTGAFLGTLAYLLILWFIRKRKRKMNLSDFIFVSIFFLFCFCLIHYE